MRTGIFGGTFNPVHTGHVRAAEFFIKEMNLDRLFVLPNFIPPLKSNDTVSASERFEMLRIAFCGANNVFIDDFEIKNGGTSYTWMTIKHYKELYPEDELFLLVGDDNLLIFKKWMNFEYILSNCTICVARRSGADITDIKNSLEKENNAHIEILSYDPTVISSTELRDSHLECGRMKEYLPQKVYDYIKEKELYK